MTVSRDILTGIPDAGTETVESCLNALDNLVYTPLTPIDNGFKFVAPDGKVYRALTDLQREMAESMFQGMSVAARLHRSGSKAKASNVYNPATSSRYFTSPVFKNYILELWVEYKSVSQLNRDDFKHEIHALGKKAEKAGNYSVAMKSVELRGKLEGFFEKSDTSDRGDTEKSLKSVTEELEELLTNVRIREKQVISEQ